MIALDRCLAWMIGRAMVMPGLVMHDDTQLGKPPIGHAVEVERLQQGRPTARHTTSTSKYEHDVVCPEGLE